MKPSKMSIFDRIKGFLGKFNLTPLESELITRLKQSIPKKYAAIIEDQFRLFNRVDRALVDDGRLDHGDTFFYWIKSGKSCLDFPSRLPYQTEESTLAETSIKSGQNIISVRFVMVRGVMCCIEFRSKSKKYQPTEEYVIGDYLINEELASADT